MDHWPTPSLLDRFLFEQWRPATLLLAGLALVLGFHALRHRNKAMGIVAGVLLIVAGLAPVIETSVHTPRERMVAATFDLAEAAIGPYDRDQLSAMLSQNVVFEVPAGNPVFNNRQEVLDLAERADRVYTFEDWSLSGTDAVAMSPTSGESHTRLSAKLASRGGGGAGDIFAGSGFGVPTEWQVHWKNNGDQWVVERIVVTKIAGEDASKAMLP